MVWMTQKKNVFKIDLPKVSKRQIRLTGFSTACCLVFFVFNQTTYHFAAGVMRCNAKRGFTEHGRPGIGASSCRVCTRRAQTRQASEDRWAKYRDELSICLSAS